MYNITNYNDVKKILLEQGGKWQEHIAFLEEMVDTLGIIKCYPKGMLRDGFTSVEIIMVFDEKIITVILGFENEIKVYKMSTLIKLDLYFKRTGSVEFRIFLQGADVIVLSSENDTNEENKEIFGKALIEMYKLLNA